MIDNGAAAADQLNNGGNGDLQAESMLQIVPSSNLVARLGG